jgi:HD-like signal output (HDOD) protein
VAILSAEELIGDNLNPVSLPGIVIKLNHLLHTADSSTTDILNTISQDPVLSARLLKLINSSFYDFPSRIDTLNKAVTVLGTKSLCELVIACSIIGKFRFTPDIDFDLETFWCHSIATGIAARNIAQSQNLDASERFFIAGLIHDIGKLVMAMLLPGETESLNRINTNTKLVMAHPEEQIFGFTHEQLGSKLIENWHFPEAYSQPVLHHHDLDASNEFKKDSAILHIANIIANNIQAPVSKDDDTILDPEALVILGIDQATMESFYEGVYNMLDGVEQVLYYDL